MGPRDQKMQEQNACEDLKALERRLTEVIGYMNPSAGRWRIVLVLSSVSTIVGAWLWLADPVTMEVRFVESLWNHLFFTLSIFLLLFLFLCGIHKRVVAPSIVASRCRSALADFNMSCDESGWVDEERKKRMLVEKEMSSDPDPDSLQAVFFLIVACVIKWWTVVVMLAVTALVGVMGQETTKTSKTDPEKTCQKEAKAVLVPMILLVCVPPVVNIITIALLALLIARIRAIRSANDEVFQSTMLLTRTALRVTIPRRAVESIQKVIGDPKDALKTRLSEENAKKQKKNN